jgi:type VI secretion system protein ImpB
MPAESSPKFIKRNRAPRVHIEYEVETGGAVVLKEIPFVLGVMADLSGKPLEELPPVDQRKFAAVDVDNFNSFLKSTRPRVAFQVPNKLTGEGSLNVDLAFESLDDFSPGALVRRVDGLKELFAAREKLNSMLTRAESKARVQALVQELLSQPALLEQIARGVEASASAPSEPAAQT